MGPVNLIESLMSKG